MQNFKDYLGDGVYADYDGFAIVLTTENGIENANTIYLEPHVLTALNRYVEHIGRTIEDRDAAKDATIGNDNKEDGK